MYTVTYEGRKYYISGHKFVALLCVGIAVAGGVVYSLYSVYTGWGLLAYIVMFSSITINSTRYAILPDTPLVDKVSTAVVFAAVAIFVYRLLSAGLP